MFSAKCKQLYGKKLYICKCSFGIVSIRNGTHLGSHSCKKMFIRDSAIIRMTYIWDGVHSGWRLFEMMSIRDRALSGSCFFGIVSLRDLSIWDCALSRLCPFEIVSIRERAHLGFVPIRDCVHSRLYLFENVLIWGSCPFGIVYVRNCFLRDRVYWGSCPFGIVHVRDCVRSRLCSLGLCFSVLRHLYNCPDTGEIWLILFFCLICLKFTSINQCSKKKTKSSLLKLFFRIFVKSKIWLRDSSRINILTKVLLDMA